MACRHSSALLTVGLLLSTLASGQTDQDIEEAIRVFNRGKTLHQERRYEAAIREYRTAVKLDAENPFVFNALGLALAAVGNFKDALKAFDRAIQINPDLTDVYNNIGMVHAESGNTEKAFEAFGRAVRNPNYLTPEKALYNMGNLYLEDGNLELAIMHFKRSVEKKPEFGLGYRGLGKAYILLGDVDGAQREFLKAVGLYEADVESLYQLAKIHESRGETDQAVEYYRRVVEVDRFSPFGRLALSNLDTLKSANP